MVGLKEVFRFHVIALIMRIDLTKGGGSVHFSGVCLFRGSSIYTSMGLCFAHVCTSST